jgi:hypothetical protein
VLFAFDLIEHDGDDLRDLALIERKRRLARLLGRAKRRSIRFSPNADHGLNLNDRAGDRARFSRRDAAADRLVPVALARSKNMDW